SFGSAANKSVPSPFGRGPLACAHESLTPPLSRRERENVGEGCRRGRMSRRARSRGTGPSGTHAPTASPPRRRAKVGGNIVPRMSASEPPPDPLDQSITAEVGGGVVAPVERPEPESATGQLLG